MPPPQYMDASVAGEDISLRDDEQDRLRHEGGVVTMPKFVGVIGGMGPMASVDFMGKIVEETDAMDDQHHVPVMMLQWPQIPSRADAILDGGKSPLPTMLTALRVLETSGVAAVCVPCVTAHHWYPDLLRMAKVPMLNIVDAILQNLQESGVVPCSNTIRSTGSGHRPRIGILATAATQASGFLEGRLLAAGYDVVFNTQEEQEEYVATAIKLTKNDHAEVAAPLFEQALKLLVERHHAERAILACTELPLLLPRVKDPKLAASCVDTNRAFAKYVVRWWMQNAHHSS